VDKAGYDVTIIAQHHKDEIVDGLRILSLKRTRNRLKRIICLTFKAFNMARKMKSDIYHFHDPEFIPFGLLLKLIGKRVIYDVHENVQLDILSKDWISFWLRKPVSKVVELIETLGSLTFNTIIAATPNIAQKFEKHKTMIVQNFPIAAENVLKKVDSCKKNPPVIAYVGDITIIRGIKQMLQAVTLITNRHRVRLVLAGSFNPPELETEVKKMAGWEHVEYVGWQTKKEVARILRKAYMGIILFHPVPNHLTYIIHKFQKKSFSIPK